MIPVIEAQDLIMYFPLPSRREKVHALNGVSLKISRGQTIGVVGESGSGKSTLGRCVLRLLKPSGGRVYFQGKDIISMSERELQSLRPKMQMVFQDPYDSLNPRMKVGDIIEEPLLLHDRLTRAQRRERVLDLIQRVQLSEEHIQYYPNQLSGGQQQRVCIARAIATHPDFIVLDEPTSSLDLSIRSEIILLLQRLQQELGLSYLFISHDLSTIRHLSMSVLVMYLGRVVEVGSGEQIFDTPLHPYTKALVSAILIPDPTKKRMILTLQGEIPSPITLPKGCYLYSRCPIASGKCEKNAPELISVNEHQVACFAVHP